MGRMSKEEIRAVKKAIADLIYNNKDKVEFVNGKPSATHVAKLLKRDYGYDVSRQTVAKYLKKGVEKYREMLLIEDNEKIRDIKEAMRVQKSIWKSSDTKPADRTKAANAWRQLQKQLMKYEEQLAEAEIKKAEVSRPNYLINIKPRNILVECPNCGHKFYDMDESKEYKEDDEE